MALKKVRITGINGGRARSKFFPQAGQFTSSLGIDPDLSVGSQTQASGLAIPSAYVKFSGSSAQATTIAVITNPKNTLIYAVTSDGRIISYTSSFGSETLVATVAGSNAGGAAYYNNYIYVLGTGASKNDVSRYGPLSNSPTLTDAWWSGLGLTALTDTSYPSVRLARLPNHWAWVHTDDILYFCDFANGQGIINRISTVKGTFEGDTNSTVIPSAYNVLDLPFGYYPTSIASYSTSVAISATQSVDDVNGVNQGNAGLFIWNPTNEVTFDQQIQFPDPVASALLARNGRLFAFSGNILRGCRVTEYVGGSTLQELAYVDDGSVPLAGSVEAFGERAFWGSYAKQPTESACVWAINSRTRSSPNDVQNVVAVGAQGTLETQSITALRWVGQQSGDESDPQIVVAYDEDTAASKGLYRKTSGGAGTIGSAIELPIVTVGQEFRIDRIRVPLSAPMASGSSMELTVIYDDGISTSTPLTISNSVQGSASRVTFKTPQITGKGQNNFRIKVNMIGTNATVATGIAFPIEVVLELFDDEPLWG